MCSDENMFDFSFRSSLICFRLSYCLLIIWSALSRDTFNLLADESIMILCCLLWYVSNNCLSSSSYCLLLLSHCSWNNFRFLDKEPINSFFYFSINICVVCHEKFLSTATVILFLVYFFYPIVIETPSVWWIRNQPVVFVQIFDLYITDPICLEMCQNSLFLERYFYSWAIYCSEIDII